MRGECGGTAANAETCRLRPGLRDRDHSNQRVELWSRAPAVDVNARLHRTLPSRWRGDDPMFGMCGMAGPLAKFSASLP